MKIPSLLNPSYGDAESLGGSTNSTQESNSGRRKSRNLFHKRLKEVKDAPKYEEGQPIGSVSYPPFEAETLDMLGHYERFNIRPMGCIAKYPRNIPYSSEKKRFHVKTGRDSFNVFQYTFRYGGSDDDTEYGTNENDPSDWRVVWDYNIGLVRITPFFKSQGHTKTIPAKAISMNPGLMDLCHSITGGALVAQGYWMPFQAAKALAATFCWRIRHALVPLFGPDFVDCCIDPADPVYKRFTIEPIIIKHCASTMQALKARLGASRPNSEQDCHLRPSSVSSSGFGSESRLKPRKRSRRHGVPLARNSNSDYDAGGHGPELTKQHASGFTAVNHPRKWSPIPLDSIAAAPGSISSLQEALSSASQDSPFTALTNITKNETDTASSNIATHQKHTPRMKKKRKVKQGLLEAAKLYDVFRDSDL
ncbi:MAG: hypothetical protein M1828_002218 [Chrysothrix sp. TS-e1954]|nr:MAG: hypothetical protein M1828_002218 [Chrysothrix sp. TS-e1954]